MSRKHLQEVKTHLAVLPFLPLFLRFKASVVNRLLRKPYCLSSRPPCLTKNTEGLLSNNFSNNFPAQSKGHRGLYKDSEPSGLSPFLSKTTRNFYDVLGKHPSTRHLLQTYVSSYDWVLTQFTRCLMASFGMPSIPVEMSFFKDRQPSSVLPFRWMIDLPPSQLPAVS